MSLTPSEAADSLKAIAQTGRRSAQAYSYAHSSPHFILWGLVWLIGYAGSDLLPRWGAPHLVGWLWNAATVIGIATSFWIGRRQSLAAPGVGDRKTGLRWFASFVVIWLFVAAVFAIMHPVNPLVQGAFFPLIVAMFYALLGVWKGLRFLIAGAVVSTATLFGFFYLPQIFLLWMAVVGGGSLILVGLWLKKV